MSCSSCTNNTPLPNAPRSCGIDPCFAYKTSTDLVFYTGDNLSCTGINKCDNLTLSLQKIDVKLCPEAIAEAIFTAISQDPSLLNMFCELVTGCIPITTTTTSSSSTSTTTSTSTSSTTSTTSTSTSSTTSTSTTTRVLFSVSTYDCIGGEILYTSTCAALGIGCFVYTDPAGTIPVPDGIICADSGLTSCFTISGGFGEITGVGSCG